MTTTVSILNPATNGHKINIQTVDPTQLANVQLYDVLTLPPNGSHLDYVWSGRALLITEGEAASAELPESE